MTTWKLNPWLWPESKEAGSLAYSSSRWTGSGSTVKDLSLEIGWHLKVPSISHKIDGYIERWLTHIHFYQTFSALIILINSLCYSSVVLEHVKAPIYENYRHNKPVKFHWMVQVARSFSWSLLEGGCTRKMTSKLSWKWILKDLEFSDVRSSISWLST